MELALDVKNVFLGGERRKCLEPDIVDWSDASRRSRTIVTSKCISALQRPVRARLPWLVFPHDYSRSRLNLALPCSVITPGLQAHPGRLSRPFVLAAGPDPAKAPARGV